MEQAYLDRAYAHLARMRARTKQATEIADNAAQEVDSAIAKAHLNARLRSLDTEVDGLAFGRLDAEGGDTWYVGRRHVEDEAGDPVVVDWRAPGVHALLPSHRGRPARAPAAAAVPDDGAPRRRPVRRGVRRPRQRRRRAPRRHPRPAARRARACPHRRDARHRRHDRGGAGRGDPRPARHLPRRAGRARHRQDRGRASTEPPSSCSSTGSSSTARACSSSGPNPLFLQYIAQVLPSLGRGGHAPDDRRAAGGRAGRRARTPPEVARLKGDARMAPLLVTARSAPPPRPDRGPRRVAPRGDRCGSPPRDLADAVEEIVARDVPFAVGRNAFRTRVRRLAWLGPPGLEVGGRRAHRRVRRRDAHEHRAEHRRGRGSGRRCRRRCS